MDDVKFTYPKEQLAKHLRKDAIEEIAEGKNTVLIIDGINKSKYSLFSLYYKKDKEGKESIIMEGIGNS